MSLDLDIKEILELEQDNSNIQSNAFEKLRKLQEKIKVGESTGDRIRDFVIVNVGVISEEVETSYKKLEADLDRKSGSRVLVVEQKESINGCPGFGAPDYIDPMFIGIDTELKLGVLTSSDFELNILEGKILLPTEKYAKKSDKNWRDKWKLEEGPIKIGWYEFMNLGKTIEKRRIPMPNNLFADFQHGMTIHLGEEVEQYFTKNPFGLSDRKYLDTSYVEALDLLGEEAPKKFREKYDEEIFVRKIDIIRNLEELTSIEYSLNNKIKSIFANVDGRPRTGGDILYSTGPELPGPTRDDAIVASHAFQKGLRETQGKIRGILEEAMKLDMHKRALILEGDKPGISINVPEYISKMCERYKVEV